MSLKTFFLLVSFVSFLIAAFQWEWAPHGVSWMQLGFASYVGSLIDFSGLIKKLRS